MARPRGQIAPLRRRRHPEVWVANVPASHIEAFSDPVDGVYQSRRIVPADGQICPIAFPDVVLTVGDFLFE